MSVQSYSLPPDTKLEGYHIQRVLGVGGFSITYLAKDESLNCDVAIKEYFPASIAVREPGLPIVTANTNENADLYEYGLKRFLEEARTLAQFKSPYVVRVTRFIEANNTAYIIMDYEDGVPLSRYLMSAKKLNESELLQVIFPIMEGLQAVHTQGILHRDIKPSNIYLRKNGSPVLLDFGAARQTVNRDTTVMSGLVTHGYSPFEQYHSRDKEGPWTDIYSLGATLYKCITGQTPNDALDRLAAKQANDRDPLVKLVDYKAGEMDVDLLKCIDRMLSVTIQDRPQSIVEILPYFEVKDGISQYNSSHHSSVKQNVVWDSGLVTSIEDELMKYVGPVAKILVQENLKKVSDIHELYHALATSIEATEDRDQFLSKLDSQVSQPNKLWNTGNHNAIDNNRVVRKIDITMTAMSIIEENLTQYVGPVAAVLMESISENVTSREELIDKLAMEIPTERERREFKNRVTNSGDFK